MNRRGFLGALTGLISTAALDPEKLLWIPGKKTISVPSGIVMPEPFRGAIVGVATQDIAAGQYGMLQIYGMIDMVTDGTMSRWDGTRFDGPRAFRNIKAGKTFVRGDFVYSRDIEYDKYDHAAPPWYDTSSKVYGADPVFRNSNPKAS